MSRLRILPTSIKGLTVLEREPFEDGRGYFERIFCEKTLSDLLSGRRIIQINHSVTRRRGTVRGLHFQYPPYAETKIVYCMRGEMYDIAVDLRRDSPTFLQWHAEILCADTHRALVIPEGFAHGFQSLTDDCDMLYLNTAEYHPEAESGVSMKDPRLKINWPLPITDLSQRDANIPLLTDDFTGVAL